MNTYISTCISGTTEIVKRIISSRVRDVRFILEYDGLVMYRSASEASDIKQIRGVNNSFLVVKSFKKGDVRDIEDLVLRAIRDLSVIREIQQYYGKKRSRVRVMASVHNQSIALSRSLLEKFESKIVERSQIKIDRRLAESEIWFLEREEGSFFITIRLTNSRVGEKDLLPGQIRPELAHLLSFLSEPSVEDIVLDPFSGSGALVFERTNFKYREIIAVEKNAELVKSLEEKVKKQNKKVQVIHGDALHLKLDDGSVNVVITDPPWGLFDSSIKDLKSFYDQMFIELARVLKSGGRLVLLSGQKEVVDDLASVPGFSFELFLRYDVLVSGKKAGIYVFNRR